MTLRSYHISESKALSDFTCDHVTCKKEVKEGETLARVYCSRILQDGTEKIMYTCGWACAQCFITWQETQDVKTVAESHLSVNKAGIVVVTVLG